MSAYPPDVLKAARDAYAKALATADSGAICEAILAERERCARKVDFFESINPQASYIAAAIRKGAA